MPRYRGFIRFLLLVSVLGPVDAVWAMDKPRLEFQRIIGDLRGRSLENYGVAVTESKKRGQAHLLTRCLVSRSMS